MQFPGGSELISYLVQQIGLLKPFLPGLPRILRDRLAERNFTLHHVCPIYFSLLRFHISKWISPSSAWIGSTQVCALVPLSAGVEF